MKVLYQLLLPALCFLLACSAGENKESLVLDNPEVPVRVPPGFPPVNPAIHTNRPTAYGVALGRQLFHDPKLSANNSISCASCHRQSYAYADSNKQAVGIYGRVGMRNTPPIQNMAFMQFYNRDGSKLNLESQTLVPIITHEEMDASMVQVIARLKADQAYVNLFRNAFGDELISPERIYRSIAQYEYTLVSANSKYDRMKQQEGERFTQSEWKGYQIFRVKCIGCHSTELFTDQSFRQVGFPLNPNADEVGRARITGEKDDLMRFRVPSLRNAEYTAPYGSFGQFPTLRAVLDYYDQGVLYSDNLDPILKKAGNRIPLSETEKDDILAFIRTLSDSTFTGK